ncbi:MAG: YCF48-related protein [Bacteroidia bacterium]|nr:YCF48-related protein [Bacteroidia bacterium]
MKLRGFCSSVLMILLIMIVSCSKNPDDNLPDESKYAWAVGEQDSTGYGMILYSDDRGETWVRQGQGSSALQGIDVYDIWAVDKDNVWAACGDNVILKTIDGGMIWSRVQVPVTKSHSRLSSICIVNKTNIWISGSGGAVYKSANNGQNWTLFDTTFFQSGLMQGICAVTPNKVYVVGGVHTPPVGFIGYTLDGGSIWDSVVPQDNYNRNEWIGAAASVNTIVIYGEKSHYMVSLDGGSIWKNDSIPASGGVGGADINHLIMQDAKTWWAAMDLGKMYLTTDGGTNWNLQQTDRTGDFIMGIDAWHGQLALAAGQGAYWPKGGSILKYSIAKNSWITKYTTRSCLYKVSFIKP